MPWGEYASEYNPKIHGPYDPARYYGKPDTPLSKVKLGEFGAWLSRRNMSATAIIQCMDRARWRWAHKYVLCKNGGFAPILQVMSGLAVIHYFWQYKSHTNEKPAKYSW